MIQPANALTVKLFVLCRHCWLRAGMEGTPTGLDVNQVEIRAQKLKWYKQLDDDSMERLWTGLDVMADACLDVWANDRATRATR